MISFKASNGTFRQVLQKVEQALASKEEGFPYITKDSRWQRNPAGFWSWTSGFWVGLLWLAYRLTGETSLERAARMELCKLESLLDAEEANFDLGFLFYPAAVLGYQITGEGLLRNIALCAADRLVGFIHKEAGLIYCLKSQQTKDCVESTGYSIIDVMPNLELLWWASAETGRSDYFDIAFRHTERALDLFLREDGSSFQMVKFDLATGKILARGALHGLNDATCWARGQAWGIYGFALAALRAGDARFAQATRQLSDYYLEKTPGDRVPYWDFEDPMSPDCVRDSSAAAIACAAWRCFCADLPSLQGYYEEGAHLLETLSVDYLQPVSKDGILSHGCAYKKKGVGIDESTIWGDYYFLLALLSKQIY